jgi:hypothetical protein
MFSPGEDDWVMENLKAHGIEALRMSKLRPELFSQEYYLPRDGHPNGKAFAIVAGELMRAIPKSEELQAVH